MDMTRLNDGNSRFVLQTALNLDAVIRPERILNHNLDLACSLVLASTSFASSGVT